MVCLRFHTNRFKPLFLESNGSADGPPSYDRKVESAREEKLLTKGRAEALDLFEDILSRVQYEYVEPIKETRFVAHGTESLYMALKNDRFTAKNKLDDKTEGILIFDSVTEEATERIIKN